MVERVSDSEANLDQDREQHVGLNELLAHEGWVRRLALQLSPNAEVAEDITQQTWLAALEAPPRARTRRWLSRVLRNQAALHYRKQGSRSYHEHQSSLSRPSEASDTVDQKREVHEALTSILLELDEPIRAPLMLRFWEGQDSYQIGEHLSVPASTVRWRLQQGISLLREQLNRRYGGESAKWLQALALFLPKRKTASVVAAAGVTGAVAWSWKHWLGAAVALLLLGWGASVSFQDLGSVQASDQDVAFLEEEASRVEIPAADSPLNSVRSELLRSEERDFLASPAELTAPDESAARAPLARDVSVRVQVLDESGLPVQGATVFVEDHGQSAFDSTVDAKGVATLRVPSAAFNGGGYPEAKGRLPIRARAQGYQSSRLFHLSPQAASHSLEESLSVRISHGGVRVSGQVHNDLGHAIEGARVAFAIDQPYQQDDRENGVMVTRAPLVTWTDANGAFDLDGLAQQSYRVRCFAEGHADVEHARDLEELHGKELRLPMIRGAEIEGFVRMPDGKAASRARVWFDPLEDAHPMNYAAYPGYQGRLMGFSRVVETDSLGAFRLDSVPSGSVTLWAQSIDQPSRVASLGLAVDPGASYTLDFDLLVRESVQVQALNDAHGLLQQNPGVYVSLGPGKYGISNWKRFVPLNSNGQATLYDVPSMPLLAVLFDERMMDRPMGSKVFESEGVKRMEVSFLKSGETVVRGYLRTRQGEPIALGAVHAYYLESDVAGEIGIDDLDGAFEADLPAGRWIFHASNPEQGSFPVGSFTLADGEVRALELEAPDPGWLGRGAVSEESEMTGRYELYGYLDAEARWDYELLIHSGEGPLPGQLALYPGLFRLHRKRGERETNRWVVIQSGREQVLEAEANRMAVDIPIRAVGGLYSQSTPGTSLSVHRLGDPSESTVLEDPDGSQALLDGLWILRLEPGRYRAQAQDLAGQSGRIEFEVSMEGTKRVLPLVLK